MPKHAIWILIALAAAPLCAHAQWLNYPDAHTPRTRDGKPNLAAPAPRAPDGKPDLTGVWQAQPTPFAELKSLFGGFVEAIDKFSVPGSDVKAGASKYFFSVFADFKPEDAPMQRPGTPVSPEKGGGVCMPEGIPIASLIPAPHKIVQSPREIVIMYEDDSTHRQIYTDGRGLPKEILQPAWLGYSVGHWERDTLVVETAGFNDKSRLDILRHPHSEALHVVERYHRRDFGHMDVEMNFDDPQMYTKPFAIKLTEELQPDTDILESFCNENEKDRAHMLNTLDRARLNETVDTYLGALVAHDPSHVPFATDVKFVENAVPMKPGDGLWKTASEGPAAFKIYVPDPGAQQVGLVGAMKEGGKLILLGLRLKLEGGKITEAEHVVVRNVAERNLPNLQTPRPGLLATVPPAERVPREEMLKIGKSYYEAIVESKGDAAPFADDCARRENGLQTTTLGSPPQTPGLSSLGAMGCRDQMNTGLLSYITRIDQRRVEIADPETGLVFGLSQFRMPMQQSFVKIAGVPGLDRLDLSMLGLSGPVDFSAVHIYKIQGGKIHEIESMGFRMPYNPKTGWENKGK